jgi:transposase-like protein
MSKARLVITAVVLEGRSQSEVARTYGVSQSWVSRLVARYRLEGEQAFQPRSRRPLRSPDYHHRIRRDVVDAAGKLTLRVDGRLLHIGVGRTHARTPVVLLVHDLDVRVVDAATGEILRTLTLDLSRSYQPTARPPGPAGRNSDI